MAIRQVVQVGDEVLRPFSKLCRDCIQTLSIDKEDIVIFKGGHVVYFLIEKCKNIQKEIIKKFESEKFSKKYLTLFDINEQQHFHRNIADIKVTTS